MNLAVAITATRGNEFCNSVSNVDVISEATLWGPVSLTKEALGNPVGSCDEMAELLVKNISNNIIIRARRAVAQS